MMRNASSAPTYTAADAAGQQVAEMVADAAGPQVAEADAAEETADVASEMLVPIRLMTGETFSVRIAADACVGDLLAHIGRERGVAYLRYTASLFRHADDAEGDVDDGGADGVNALSCTLRVAPLMNGRGCFYMLVRPVCLKDVMLTCWKQHVEQSIAAVLNGAELYDLLPDSYGLSPSKVHSSVRTNVSLSHLFDRYTFADYDDILDLVRTRDPDDDAVDDKDDAHDEDDAWIDLLDDVMETIYHAESTGEFGRLPLNLHAACRLNFPADYADDQWVAAAVHKDLFADFVRQLEARTRTALDWIYFDELDRFGDERGDPGGLSEWGERIAPRVHAMEADSSGITRERLEDEAGYTLADYCRDNWRHHPILCEEQAMESYMRENPVLYFRAAAC